MHPLCTKERDSSKVSIFQNLFNNENGVKSIQKQFLEDKEIQKSDVNKVKEILAKVKPNEINEEQKKNIQNAAEIKQESEQSSSSPPPPPPPEEEPHKSENKMNEEVEEGEVTTPCAMISTVRVKKNQNGKESLKEEVTIDIDKALGSTIVFEPNSEVRIVSRDKERGKESNGKELDDSENKKKKINKKTRGRRPRSNTPESSQPRSTKSLRRYSKDGRNKDGYRKYPKHRSRSRDREKYESYSERNYGNRNYTRSYPYSRYPKPYNYRKKPGFRKHYSRDESPPYHYQSNKLVNFREKVLKWI